MCIKLRLMGKVQLEMFSSTLCLKFYLHRVLGFTHLGNRGLELSYEVVASIIIIVVT